MTFNIDTFTSEQDKRNGVLKSNRFRVMMPTPAVMAGHQTAEVSRSLEFWCSDVQIPGYQFLTANHRRYTYGTNESRPFSPNFQQLQLNVMMDGQGSVWEYFDTWMQHIMPHDVNQTFNDGTIAGRIGQRPYTMTYPDEYIVDGMVIDVYTEDGKKSKSIQLRRAYPVNINSINLSWADKDRMSSFNVFMDFLDWRVVEGSTTFPVPPEL